MLPPGATGRARPLITTRRTVRLLSVAAILGACTTLAVGAVLHAGTTASASGYTNNCRGNNGAADPYQQDAYHADSDGNNTTWDNHGWFIDWGQSCIQTSFTAGEDSRWSWGQDWHNVTTLGLSFTDYDKNGATYESQSTSRSQSAYQQIDSQQVDYYVGRGNCADHRAESSGTYDEPNIFHWTYAIHMDVGYSGSSC